jgi:hypothetical protein
MPTLPALLDELHRELELQERHSEALDTKASVFLGFAAAIVTLSSTMSWSWGLVPGQAAALISAVLAIVAMGVRRRKVWNPLHMRSEYATRPFNEGVAAIHDLRLTDWADMSAKLKTKAWTVLWVEVFLLLSAVLIATSIMLGGGD